MFADVSTGILAGAAVAQLLVLVAAAVFAKRQVEEARQLREAQARPFVVIDFEAARSLIWIKLKNTGPSLARDVRFRFDPPLRSTLDDRLPPLSQTQLFTEGIPSLAPGKEIKALFDTFPAREGQRLSGADFPDAYTVTMTYTGDPLGREYDERTIMDLGIYRNLVDSTRHDIHDIHEVLEDIKDLAKKWTSAAPQGLRIVTAEERREYREKLEEERQQRATARANGENEAGDGSR